MFVKLTLALSSLLLAASAAAALNCGSDVSPRYRDLLEELVNENSGTENQSGVAQLREHLRPFFKELGLIERTLPAEAGHSLSIFEVAGADPVVILSGHVDTVFPAKSEFQKLDCKDGVLRGPGVVDMKGGLVLLLETLAELQGKIDFKKIRVVLSDDEEIGSQFTSKVMDRAIGKAKYALVIEPGPSSGAIIDSHNGSVWLKVDVKGKAAHAGGEPEKGLNACVELAHQITEFAKLNDFKNHISVNSGLISGGTKPNIICDQADATLDIRYVLDADLERIEKSIREIAGRAHVTNSLLKLTPTTTVTKVMSMLSLTPRGNRDLLKIVNRAATAIGHELPSEHAGYSSEAGKFERLGLQALVGFGPYGGGLHTANEFMAAGAYGKRKSLLRQVLTEILHP